MKKSDVAGVPKKTRVLNGDFTEYVDIFDLKESHGFKVVKKVPILTDQLMATVLMIPPNTKIPAHVHFENDEIHYIVSGSGKISIGNKNRTIKEGMLIWVPKAKSHFFSTEKKSMVVLSNSPVCEPVMIQNDENDMKLK
ncbi:MAG: cupin domain-containing protein [Methanomassiliicoccales archaeon]|nr:MAG: cupin domain-containing protein [Methanomassiliicoccales archaeon]